VTVASVASLPRLDYHGSIDALGAGQAEGVVDNEQLSGWIQWASRFVEKLPAK
jgi:hypothetical protein